MQPRAANVRTLYVDDVRLRREIVDDQTGIERYVERDVVAASHVRWRRFGRDTRSIRDSIGVGRIATATAPVIESLFSGNVAWSNNHRKDELVRAIHVTQLFDVADGDLDLFAGKN